MKSSIAAAQHGGSDQADGRTIKTVKAKRMFCEDDHANAAVVRDGIIQPISASYPFVAFCGMSPRAGWLQHAQKPNIACKP
ncbi:MAG: hypothetical protein V4517_24005 [Pseudomonadota bacterium]